MIVPNLYFSRQKYKITSNERINFNYCLIIYKKIGTIPH